MIRRRVLIDIEFALDETQFKAARLEDDVTGVSDVTDAGVQDAVITRLIGADWAVSGLRPEHSIVTTHPSADDA